MKAKKIHKLIDSWGGYYEQVCKSSRIVSIEFSRYILLKHFNLSLSWKHVTCERCLGMRK